MKEISNAAAVSAGRSSSCAVLENGTVWCWGWNSDGILGSGDWRRKSLVPIRVKGISDAKTVRVGSFHACSSLVGGKVVCWGSNSYGQLGNGGMGYNPAPVRVIGLS